MPNAAARPSEWLPLAAGLVLGVTLYRVVLLAFNGTDLFVDEAQYWFWGQELAFGYYSKPPLIGWTIRASTELGGSDAQFWVRLPAPLLHAVTALILGWIAAARYGAQAGLWVAICYVTLPVVTVGSLMISTDTVMFPFLAAALGLWLIGLDRGGHAGLAFAAGLLAGLASLAKYAAIYGPFCAALAAGAMGQARPGWRAAGAGLAGFVLAASPNVIWNLVNGLTTLQHTLDNADWVRDPAARAGLNLQGLGEFLGGQLAVFGPVFFAALVWLGIRRGAGSDERRLLLWFSLPVLAVVSLQALLSEAYANWAVVAYQAGLLLVVPWLLSQHRAWLWGSLALHGTVALALPLATVIGTEWRSGPDDRLVLERYLGRADMSREILELARAHGGVVVADDRHVLADLYYTGRDSGVTIWAIPDVGRATHHYAQARPFPGGGPDPVLIVTDEATPPPGCDGTVHLGTLAPESGAYRRRDQDAFLVDPACLLP